MTKQHIPIHISKDLRHSTSTTPTQEKLLANSHIAVSNEDYTCTYSTNASATTLTHVLQPELINNKLLAINNSFNLLNNSEDQMD